LSAVEPVALVEDDGAIARLRRDDRRERPVSKVSPRSAREVTEDLPRSQRPDGAIGGHGPASAGAGVLHDLEARPVAQRRELEIERARRARGIDEAEAEIGRVGRVTRPDVIPLPPGLEAPGSSARDRLAI